MWRARGPERIVRIAQVGNDASERQYLITQRRELVPGPGTLSTSSSAM
jgi:hypothetical protein